MLSRARRTSGSVENCWRTPPMAFPVEPEATSLRSQSTTSRAPAAARWYATLAPIAPAPATTIRAMAGTLRVEREDEILRITLARPEARNAFDASLIAELSEAFVDVGRARAVVLAG